MRKLMVMMVALIATSALAAPMVDPDEITPSYLTYDGGEWADAVHPVCGGEDSIIFSKGGEGSVTDQGFRWKMPMPGVLVMYFGKLEVRYLISRRGQGRMHADVVGSNELKGVEFIRCPNRNATPSVPYPGKR